MEWICLFAKWKDNQMFSFSKYSYCFVVIDICFLLIFLYYCMQKDAVSIWEWACCELGNVKCCCIFCTSGLTVSERIKGLSSCFVLIYCGFRSTYDTTLACISLLSSCFLLFPLPLIQYWDMRVALWFQGHFDHYSWAQWAQVTFEDFCQYLNFFCIFNFPSISDKIWS